MNWISVEDELPEISDYVYVLISNSEGIDIARLAAPQSDGFDYMGHDGGFIGVSCYPSRSFGNPEYRAAGQGQPTHWMPLPEPPESHE